MENEMALQNLLQKYDCYSVTDLAGYIEYLEDVKADYEYIKSKFKCFVDEIDKLY